MQSGYLDNAATTQLCEASKNAVINALDCFGNPSSLHSLGMRSTQLIEQSREQLAMLLGVGANEIVFTSGGTESDNIALLCAAATGIRRGKRIVTTAIEHSAVIMSAKQLEQQGFEVIYLKPDSSGSVPIEAFEAAINSDTIAVSAMLVNNENGAFLPVSRLRGLINAAGAPALLHCDATQAFGKYPINPEQLGVDLLSFSAHKIHGPKGVGALYIKKGVRIVPRSFGGEQERRIRPGTEPLPLIAGFGAAAADIGDMTENEKKVASLKSYALQQLQALPCVVNSPENGSAYLLNISMPSFRSETLLHFLDSRGVFVSSGSACAKGKASHVLTALGLSRRLIDSALRISFCKYSEKSDVDMLVEGLSDASKRLIKSK